QFLVDRAAHRHPAVRDAVRVEPDHPHQVGLGDPWRRSVDGLSPLTARACTDAYRENVAGTRKVALPPAPVTVALVYGSSPWYAPKPRLSRQVSPGSHSVSPSPTRSMAWARKVVWQPPAPSQVAPNATAPSQSVCLRTPVMPQSWTTTSPAVASTSW